MKKFLKISSLILFALVSFLTVQAQFGTLDASFASNGTYQTTGSVVNITHSAMAELNDGKLLTTSYYRNNNTSPYFSRVSRINATGTIDNSFGGVGFFQIPTASVFNIRITSMKVQSDGKIVVAGTCTSTASTSSTRTFYVARINADGSGLDNLFNSGQGYINAPFLSSASPSSVAEVLITASGKILVVGNTNSTATSSEAITIARLNSDGSHDNSFGFLGTYAFAKVNNYNQATCATQLANGDILVGGFSATSTSFLGIAVKVVADGSAEDLSWSTNGFSYPMSGVINAITSLPSGEVVCAGTFDDKIHAVKLSSAGSLVSSFGTAGIYALNGSVSSAADLAVQTDGKLVVGGRIETTTGKENLCLLRLNTNGVLDNTFGQSGIVDLSISTSGDDFAQDITINSTGSIYAYGDTDGEEFISKFSAFWPTAVRSMYKNTELTIYPNPSSSNLSIKLNDSHVEEAKATVYNIFGRRIFTKKINAAQITNMNISGLATGKYIIQVQDDDHRTIATQKFNVQ